MIETVDGHPWIYLDDVGCQTCGHRTVWSELDSSEPLCVNCRTRRPDVCEAIRTQQLSRFSR